MVYVSLVEYGVVFLGTLLGFIDIGFECMDFWIDLIILQLIGELIPRWQLPIVLCDDLLLHLHFFVPLEFQLALS